MEGFFEGVVVDRNVEEGEDHCKIILKGHVSLGDRRNGTLVVERGEG